MGQVVSSDSTGTTHDRAYSYDSIANRMKIQNLATAIPQTPATVGTITVAYTYDHLSRLVKRAATIGTTTTTAHYLYDGWNRIDEWNGTGLAKVFPRGLALSGTPRGAGGGARAASILDITPDIRYLPNHNDGGNVNESINSNGSGTAMLAAHFEYDPIGNLTVGTFANAATFPNRFSTKPQDPATNLLYYGYRWHDPLTGKQLSYHESNTPCNTIRVSGDYFAYRIPFLSAER